MRIIPMNNEQLFLDFLIRLYVSSEEDFQSSIMKVLAYYVSLAGILPFENRPDEENVKEKLDKLLQDFQEKGNRGGARGESETPLPNS